MMKAKLNSYVGTGEARYSLCLGILRGAASSGNIFEADSFYLGDFLSSGRGGAAC